MSNLSYKSWRNVHFLSIFVLSIVLIIGHGTVNRLISETILDVFYYPFFETKRSVLELANVNLINRQLGSRLAKASVDLAMFEEASRENARLRSVLGFEPPIGYQLLPAKVVSITEDQIPISATINRGQNDSVMVNQPVINQVGLVGRIKAVMPNYAKVQLLTDPLNRVAARVASNREMGIVRYLPSSGMVLDDFPNQGIVHDGDTVISSGLGGIYSSGLRVGVVTEVHRPENQPYSVVKLQSVVNFHSIEELFILMPESR